MKKLRREEPPPPPKKGRKPLWPKLVRKVRKEPGRWFVLMEYDSPHTARVRASELRREFPDVEFAYRPVDGVGKVYARFSPKKRRKSA